MSFAEAIGDLDDFGLALNDLSAEAASEPLGQLSESEFAELAQTLLPGSDEGLLPPLLPDNALENSLDALLPATSSTAATSEQDAKLDWGALELYVVRHSVHNTMVDADGVKRYSMALTNKS